MQAVAEGLKKSTMRPWPPILGGEEDPSELIHASAECPGCGNHRHLAPDLATLATIYDAAGVFVKRHIPSPAPQPERWMGLNLPDSILLIYMIVAHCGFTNALVCIGCAIARLQGGGNKMVVELKAIPADAAAKVEYHNELMNLCGITLRELIASMDKAAKKRREMNAARGGEPGRSRSRSARRAA